MRDAINLDTPELQDCRKEGIVGVGLLPGSACLIGGIGCFIKTTCRSLVTEDAIVRDEMGLKMALGENPKRVFREQKKCFSRMGEISQLRLFFQKVLAYRDKEEKEKNPAYEIVLDLLDRKFPARMHAHQANDIQNAIHLAEEFGFDIVIEHCTEGDKIVDFLKKKKVPVVIGPPDFSIT